MYCMIVQKLTTKILNSSQHAKFFTDIIVYTNLNIKIGPSNMCRAVLPCVEKGLGFEFFLTIEL